MMKRLHAALCGALLLLAAPAWAQSPKATLNSQVQQQFPDNATGAITPATTRTFLSSVINSFQQYAGVNAQTGTTYTVQASDYGQLLTFTNASTVTVSIPAASSFGTFNFYAANIGSSSVNLVPAAGTIDGTSSLALSGNQGVWVVSDGTNYRTFHGLGGGSVSSVGLTVPSCLAVSGSPVTTTGTIAVTANGTSGGIPYFNSATTCTSSGILAANAPVIGGGAGTSPSTITAGTNNQVLHGNTGAAPSFSALTGADLPNPSATTLGGIQSTTGAANQWISSISTAGVPVLSQPSFSNISGVGACSQEPALTGDVTSTVSTCATTIAPNAVTNAKLAQGTANTLKGNPTGATANEQDVTLGATLVFSGTALQTAAHTGDVTTSANSFATTIAAGAVTNAKQANMAAWTIKLNNTSGATAPQDLTIDQLTAKASPVAADEVMIWDSVALATKKATVSSISTAGSVGSYNGRTGSVTSQGDDYGKFNVVQGTTNCSITATVATNNLTIAMTDAAGATPSATSPCVVNFRNATAGSGTTVTRTVTSATTLVLNSGSTLGTTSAVPFRVWVEFFDTGTTAVIGASLQSVVSTSTPQIFPLAEDGVASSTACSACGTATSAGTFYTTAAQTSEPFRIAGYLEWGAGLTTAGTWASAPTRIQPFTAGTRKPGDSVQRVHLFNATSSTTTLNTMQSSNTTKSIGLTASMNFVDVFWGGNATTSNGLNSTTLCQLFRGSTALGPQMFGGDTASAVLVGSVVSAHYLDAPGTTSSTTYTVKFENQDNVTSAAFGSGNSGTMVLEEIMGANDNIPGVPALPKAA